MKDTLCGILVTLCFFVPGATAPAADAGNTSDAFDAVNPLIGASGVFAIGAPQFPKITMQLLKHGALRPFEIVARKLSERNLYVQSVTLDGRPLPRPFISYSQIMNGHRLEFEMGSRPNYNWK